MHPKTTSLKRELRAAGSLEEKLGRLREAYAGEPCFLLSCGPSLNETLDAAARRFLASRLVVAVKQAYKLAPEIVDVHLLNSWNYERYDYGDDRPIVIAERADDDPPTPSLDPDLLLRVPDPRNFAERLATSLEFDRWLLERSPERPWGPGIVYELGIYLAVHVGASQLVTLGWDLGELDSPTMEHFFDEKDAAGSPEAPENQPRIRSYEVGDIAESTRALYYWLRSKGIELKVVSDRSLVDEVVPRVRLEESLASTRTYRTRLIQPESLARGRGSRPPGWACTPREEAVRAVERDGQRSIELAPVSRWRQTSVFREVALDPYFRGGRIRARLRGAAAEKGRLALVVGLFEGRRDRSPVIVSADHPGDGEWHEVDAELDVPLDHAARFAKICGVLRAGARRPARLQELWATFEK